MGSATNQWAELRTGKKFQMAINANLGWKISSNDIIYAGDDSRIIEPDTIKRLRELSYEYEIGILSPTIDGLCAFQRADPSESNFPVNVLDFVGFVFVYIRREVIEKIGYLDERFEGYGWEDLDYCFRARRAGFMIGMARDIHVKHGVDGKTYGSTFIRMTGEKEMAKQDAANRARFAEKWGLDPNDTRGIFEAIRTLQGTEQK